MNAFKNSSFNIRVKRARQVTSAYSLRGYITRSVLSKFGASEYIELDGMYAAAIKRIVGEMDVEVAKNNEKSSWVFIPVRSSQKIIDNILYDTYCSMIGLADQEEDLNEETECPDEEEIEIEQEETVVEPELEEQSVEETIESSQEEVVADIEQEESPVVEEKVETVQPVEVKPVIPQPDQRRNNNYVPRNNQPGNYKK